MKKILICIILGIGLTTVGCVSANNSGSNSSPPGDNSSVSGERQNKFEYKNTNYGNVKILIDKDTGLEYILVNGKTITPRYSQYTSENSNTILKTP